MGTRTATAPGVGIPGTPVNAAAQPQVTATDTAKALSLEAIEARMTSVTALSPEGKAYVEKLSAILTKTGAVTVEQIPYRIESVACINQAAKQAIVLVFHESSVATPANTPITEFMPDIHNAFKNKHLDVQMIQYIIVTKEDYDRVENMATHILNAFVALDPNNSLNAAMFEKMRLTPSTDLKQVKAFIAQHSPHAVQERADWGVLINRIMPNERVNSYQNIKEPELRPICGITGYTKFIQIYDRGVRKYLPICVITNVTCTVPSTDILSLALPIAAGCVISQKQWERPYTSFAKDKPNLGRLILDPAAKSLKWFSNLDEMHMEMAKYIVEIPLLAMDCAEGRARIPGLEKFIINGAAAVTEQLTKFFGPQAAASFMQMGQSPIITTFFNYEGSYKAGGQTLDTRNGDFINMVTETKDYNRCQRALAQSLTPAQHIQDIAAIYGEDAVTPLYRVHTIVYNSMLINILAQMVSGIVVYQSEACVNQNVDMAALLAQYQTQIGGSNAIYGAFGGYVTPGNLYC